MKASFKFSPKILARLGEELNQTFEQSIIELVKNSYDADARKCTIKMSSTLASGGQIIIEDDGVGMLPQQIVNSWLVLGSSTKSSVEKTRKGRFPAGNKGLGRLAALRMGREVVLSSVSSKKKGFESSLHIDWADYDGAPTVENVPVNISQRRVRKRNGTSIKLKSLRAPISAAEVRKLARSLVLLSNPFQDNAAGFEVQLVAGDYGDVASIVTKKYFEFSDFHLKATLSESGEPDFKILDWRDEVLAHEQPISTYQAPPLEFDFWVFILNKTGYSTGKVSQTELKGWLSSYGGVHVYERGVRVSPYGNQGDDWLQINLSRARSPEERPSTNNSIGRLSIRPSTKYFLTQKTDRSGFIEDESYAVVKSFATDALNWLAKWRLKQAEARRNKESQDAPKDTVRERSKVEAVLSSAPPEIQDSLRAAFKGYEKTRDREADSLRKDIQLYRTLSTAGITAATFAHESQGNPLKLIDMGIRALRTRVPKIVPASQAPKIMGPVDDIATASMGLSVLSAATLSLVQSSKRRLGKVEVHETIRRIEKFFNPFLLARGARLSLVIGHGAPFLRSSEAAIESIITNLINNSLSIFEISGTENRIIQISTELSAGEVAIIVCDSGPGIVGMDVLDIWLPGVTSNPEGTGLGLTIVRDTVRDLGGSVSAEPHGHLGGAEFRIVLPILGV
ncbi:ATP-binding protein [Xanthomonas campestris pv. campestris]|uniref:sensor histidine kinase n=1 Tax=Xanthomonas campestris TaxID=339 RepID=UPI002AD2DDF6|nr:ATP-binding protein [Xanthomonas campestris]MEA0736877.1 ATP-binding protein [Xanthomonas campestris pv. campestris]